MEILCLFLSIFVYLSIYLSLCPSLRYPSIHPSTSPVSLALSLPSSPLRSIPPLSSVPLRLVLLPLPNGETVSSRYSWGSRIARGLVTRLRTHLLRARQLGPSVHQATILLISARIGSVAKCSQDYQFTMARGELRSVPKTMQNIARYFDSI